MGTPPLVAEHIDEGESLVRALDERGHFPVTAAFWYFIPDADEWRLFLASPVVSDLGPREAYARVSQALDQGSLSLPLSAISVVSPDDDLVGLLEEGVRTGPGVFGIRFSGNVRGVYIEDAYVYRIWETPGSKGRRGADFQSEIRKARSLFDQQQLTPPYWEFAVRPSEALERSLSLPTLRRIRNKSVVQLRGWDFPHIDRHNDHAFSDGLESVTHWQYHHEAHRFYRSGLFIWRRRFQEEYEEGLANRLMLSGTVYLFTEFFVFASKLADGMELFEAELSLEGRGLEGRSLWERRSPMPMYVASVDEFRRAQVFSVQELRSGFLGSAADWVRDLFLLFGYEDQGEVKFWQERFLDRKPIG